jgi:nitrite transporter NirC
MFGDVFGELGNAARAKCAFLAKNPVGYFFAAALAGGFVGFGVLLAFSIGGQLSGAPYTSLAMGLSFGIALSLVVMAGAELFTGLNLVSFAGLVQKTISVAQAVKVSVACYVGNWLGAIVLAGIFFLTGLANTGVGEFVATIAARKMSTPVVELLFRGVLCNTLVCLAVWCGFRCKSESGKLIMIFWCLFAFVTSGFEHCIANMTLLTLALFTHLGEGISLGGYFYNLSIVTLGNIIGGTVFVALPYCIISRKKGDE